MLRSQQSATPPWPHFAVCMGASNPNPTNTTQYSLLTETRLADGSPAKKHRRFARSSLTNPWIGSKLKFMTNLKRGLMATVRFRLVTISNSAKRSPTSACTALAALSSISCTAANCAAPAMTNTVKPIVCAKVSPASKATTPNSVANGTTTKLNGNPSLRPAQKADLSVEVVIGLA